jgi:Uma2 family endonuclease
LRIKAHHGISREDAKAPMRKEEKRRAAKKRLIGYSSASRIRRGLKVMLTYETRHLLDETVLTIPASVVDLQSFREWTKSRDFPRKGRIDYIEGNIEVDMSPSNIQRHGLPKTRVGTFIDTFAQSRGLGQVFIDQTRVVSSDPTLSCEPDILFVSWKRIATGEIIFRPSANPSDNYDQMEIDGGPDLVVEVLSPSSILKDTQRLKLAYFKAGVLEYWIVDAMGKMPRLIIFRRGKNGFNAVSADRQGYLRSGVLGIAVKLNCEKGPVPNTLVYTVLSK